MDTTCEEVIREGGARAGTAVVATLLVVLLGTGFPDCVANAYVAIVNKEDHGQIDIVPAPDAVTVDGDLGEWDMRAAIEMFIDETSRATHAVRGAMMYDGQALYVGGHVKDPTPMRNLHAFGGRPELAWDADAVQLRLVAHPDIESRASLQSGGRMAEDEQHYVNHITLWYSTQDGAAGYHASYTLHFRDAVVNPAGVRGAYRQDADGRGYVFEYRIPWEVLRASRPLREGDRVQLQWQLHWGNARGDALMTGMTDVRSALGADDLGYMGPRSWGWGVVRPPGAVTAPVTERLERAVGHIPVAFALDAAAKVSVAIVDGAGRTVRTLLGARPYPAGTHRVLWDGLDDREQPVTPGEYSARFLAHEGIGQRLVLDVGVSGTPPFQTEDGTGGWAGDYGQPHYVSADGEVVVLGTGRAEAAPATIGVDLNGRKRWGGQIGDRGPLRVRDGVGYYVAVDNAELVRFDAATGRLMPFAGGRAGVALIERTPDDQHWPQRAGGWAGMAVLDDVVVVANRFEERLYIVERAGGALRDAAPLAAPFGLAPGGGGTLYAISRDRLGRYDLDSGRFEAITGALDQPRHLARDGDGDLYVALQGRTHQVWRFSPRGELLRRYGKPGGRPSLGAFDAAGMLNPYDVSVDALGRLWVAEADGQPKRYSVWRPDGELWRQFFGSLDYSTSVFVDRSEPDYLYAQSVRYKVDYETGSWAPERTILRADAPPATPALLGQHPAASRPFNLPVPSVHGGARIIVAGGRKFLWTWDGWSPGEQALYESIGDRLVPRMALVPVRGSEHGRVWIDDSNDGAVQDQEIRRGLPARWAKPDGRLNWYWHDGVQWHNQGGMKTTQPYRIVRWRFRGFNERGGLVFDDLAKAAVAAEDTDGGAVSDFTVDDDGNVFVLVSGGTLARGQRAQGSGHRIVAFGADGAKRWEYHNVHCAFAWTSSPYVPGFIVGAVHLGRGIGERLLSVTGYYGQYFLLDKRDGLFVDALGEDQRSPYTLDHRMVLTENFNGTLYEHANGKTYFAGGDADARVWELTGLDTLTRFDRRLEVSAAEAEQAMDNARRAVEAQARGVGRKFARLVRLRDAAADGRYGEWIDVARQPIFEGDTRAAAAQLGYDDGHLWIRFSVRDDSPLTNAASDYRLLFKTGDALDIALTTDLRRRSLQSQNRQRMEVGDLRIVVSRHPEGHMLATVTRPKTPGANKPSRFVYRSPVWQEVMDEVVAADHLPMHVETDSEGYVVEIGVPWEVVGATPASGRVLHGDVGVIFGNRGGTRNAVRYMWSDDSPEISVNNDLPSEARLHPNDWGAWLLQ